MSRKSNRKARKPSGKLPALAAKGVFHVGFNAGVIFVKRKMFKDITEAQGVAQGWNIYKAVRKVGAQ
jgi:hypothetical protein